MCRSRIAPAVHGLDRRRTCCKGQPVTVTYTPSGATTDVVTPSDGMGGSFSPATLTITNSAAPQTTVYTPVAYGPVSVGGSSSLGAAFTPVSTFSYGVTLDAYLDAEGKDFVLISHTQTLQGNNAYASCPVFVITDTPTFFVNGHQVRVKCTRYGGHVQQCDQRDV